MLTLEQKAKTIELLPNLADIEAIAVMRAYTKAYNEHIDWHEFAYLLDHLRAKGILTVARNDYGRMHYRLNR